MSKKNAYVVLPAGTSSQRGRKVSPKNTSSSGQNTTIRRNTMPHKQNKIPFERSMPVVKASELLGYIEYFYPTMPLFLWGKPGIGKSSIVKQFAQKKGLPLLDIRASLMDPTDLKGIPTYDKDEKHTVWLPNDFWPREGTQGILFLDELNRAPESVQNALLQLILDRRLLNYQLPEGWYIIAAGNSEDDDIGVSNLSYAFANRFAHLRLQADIHSWLAWAADNGIHPAICNYLELSPQNLCTLDMIIKENNSSTYVFATPRSWENFSKQLYAIEEAFSSKDEAETSILVIGGALIGAVVTDFLHFYKQQEEFVNIEAIQKNPQNYPLPRQISYLHKLIPYFAEKTNEMNAEALLTYILRFPQELQMLYLKTASEKIDIIKQTEAGKKLLEIHEKYILQLGEGTGSSFDRVQKTGGRRR
ncbi:hypothetical protein BREVNS_0941 [Brevinematales bacterium NS]|nr:hypothetical protein BREVNS_0941 [Brevinematales bacterium NS]